MNETLATMHSALSGLRILDFSQHLNGPLGTMLLGDFGANVIKIEPPDGDAMRRNGELLFGDDSIYFRGLNRNKRSVRLDLTTAEGRRIVHALAAQCDIVFENFRPGVAERLGIGYEALRAINPALIYCTSSAFGAEGENKDRPGMDPVVQAMSGIMQLTGDERSGPLKTGVAFCDIVSPLLSTIGVLTALQARNASGLGQKVEVSMLNATLFCMAPRDAYYFATGSSPAGIGNAHFEIVPYNTYRTADDRFVMVIAPSNKFWKILATALGAIDLLADTRLSTTAGRLEHRAVVDAGLAAAFSARALVEWTAILDKAGAMYAPVRNFDEVFSDEQVRRDMVLELNDPVAGPFKTLGNPIKLSGTPFSVRHLAPPLGADTESVLAELGIDRPST